MKWSFPIILPCEQISEKYTFLLNKNFQPQPVEVCLNHLNRLQTSNWLMSRWWYVPLHIYGRLAWCNTEHAAHHQPQRQCSHPATAPALMRRTYLHRSRSCALDQVWPLRKQLRWTHFFCRHWKAHRASRLLFSLYWDAPLARPQSS